MLEYWSSSTAQKRWTNKRKKGEEHENIDRISHLPEPLLHHIFSFLDIKQAIHASILSKRWRYFWVSLPTLNFNYLLNDPDSFNFVDFVDRVLLLRDKSSNIQKLAFMVTRFNRHCNLTSRFDRWIYTSVTQNIQELSLQFRSMSSWEFPQCLSNCKSLTKLVLCQLTGFIKIILPGPLTLPRLKSLSIESVSLQKKDSIDHGLVSERCLPVLETLILINVDFLEGSLLNISSRKLKHLRLERCRAYSVDIHLDSRNLISFYYQGPIFKHWIIENLSSLVTAYINVCDYQMNSADNKIRYAQQTANILRELHNVEELALSLKFSTEVPELFDNLLFLKLKCLKLECTVLSLELYGVIAYLLNACPNIETLCLRAHGEWGNYYPVCRCQYCNEKNSSSANQGDCWGAGWSLECMKFFEFRNVRACVNELKFIETLLSKAVVLEKLFIVFGIVESESDDDKSSRVKFRKKVLTFPRVSSRAAILFK